MKHFTMFLLLVALLAAAIPTAHASPSVPPAHQIVSSVTAVSLATFAAATSLAPGCYMRGGICVCAGPFGRLYRAPKLACKVLQ